MSAKKKTAAKNLTANQYMQLATNALLERSQLIKELIDSKRDIDAEAGYPNPLSLTDYQIMYGREGIATRLVDIFPDESWSVEPEIVEGQQETETNFEGQWKELKDNHNLFSIFNRADRLSGIGEFGVMLLGIDDGLPLDQPIDGINEKGEGPGSIKANRTLLYIRTFSQRVVTVLSVENDATNPRFGLPTSYNIQFEDQGTLTVRGQVSSSIGSKTVKVHWHRIIHLADNRGESDVYGTPRIKDVFNRLWDLRKILAGSGEMFWKGGFPGYSAELHPDLVGNVDVDDEALKKEIDAYWHGLQRIIKLEGFQLKALEMQVADPSSHFMTAVKAISIAKGIPIRLLIGTEDARLASNEDARNWNMRLKKRSERYLSPHVVRPFIDRLIAVGVLPAVQSYDVNWPDRNVKTDKDKAEIGETYSKALGNYVQMGLENLIGPQQFFSQFLGLDEETSDQLALDAERFLLRGEEEEEEEERTLEEEENNG